MPLFKFERWKKTVFNTQVKDFQFIDHVHVDYSDLYLKTFWLLLIQSGIKQMLTNGKCVVLAVYNKGEHFWTK